MRGGDCVSIDHEMGRDMQLWDISIPIRQGMPQWAGEQVVDLTPMSQTPHDHANVTRLTLTTHTGTHVDPPRHFVHGAPTIDMIPLDRWIGPCEVVEIVPSGLEIEAEDLQTVRIPDNTERLLLKTPNSALWRSNPDQFVESFHALSVAAARWVVRRGIRLIGIDYLSVAPFADGTPAHVELLRNGVLILEGIDLSAVRAGRYELLCMPLLIGNGDGAPARAALRGPYPAG